MSVVDSADHQHLSRSGKSSVQKVIFEKFSPAETLFLDPTTKIETAKMECDPTPYPPSHQH